MKKGIGFQGIVSIILSIVILLALIIVLLSFSDKGGSNVDNALGIANNL